MEGVTSTILSNKMDKYGCNLNDFRCENDIMVTITLSEYRSLVTSAATADERIRVAESDKWGRIKKIQDLEKQNEDLYRRILESSEPLMTKCEDGLDV